MTERDAQELATCGPLVALRGSFLVSWEGTLPRASEAEVLAAAAYLRSRLQD